MEIEMIGERLKEEFRLFYGPADTLAELDLRDRVLDENQEGVTGSNAAFALKAAVRKRVKQEIQENGWHSDIPPDFYEYSELIRTGAI